MVNKFKIISINFAKFQTLVVNEFMSSLAQNFKIELTSHMYLEDCLYDQTPYIGFNIIWGYTRHLPCATLNTCLWLHWSIYSYSIPELFNVCKLQQLKLQQTGLLDANITLTCSSH